MEREKPYGNGLDILTGSKDLKKLIVKRIKELGISYYMLCVDTQVPFEVFKRYLTTFNQNRNEEIKIKLSQSQLITLCERINIYPKIRITLGDKESVDMTNLQSDRLKLIKDARNKKKERELIAFFGEDYKD